MSTHSTLHAPPTSPTVQTADRQLIWHFTVTEIPSTGLWEAVGIEQKTGMRLGARRADRQAALEQLRADVDTYTAIVGGDYEADADGFARRRAGGGR